MDRVTVEVRLANNQDLLLHHGGRLPEEKIRRLVVRAVVDPSANWLILPRAVAEGLGLAKLCNATDRSSGWHPAGLDMMEEVQLELLGRTGTYRACVDPSRSAAVVGQIVLGDLDLMVDSSDGRVYPRDPDGITADLEYVCHT